MATHRTLALLPSIALIREKVINTGTLLLSFAIRFNSKFIGLIFDNLISSRFFIESISSFSTKLYIDKPINSSSVYPKTLQATLFTCIILLSKSIINNISRIEDIIFFNSTI